MRKITLEFVIKRFYNIGEDIYRINGKKCTKDLHCGYFRISYNGKLYQAHRILWVLYNQTEIPEGYIIDHKDRNPVNNSKENLRLATSSQNNQNKKLTKSTTGIKGISIQSKRNLYRAEIKVEYKRFFKYFELSENGLEQAKNWIERKRIELHKDFACNG